MTALAPMIALVGNPNAGKSALFNALTGARQKVGNYPGVTVERHSGRLALPDGRPAELVDLPGTYSLDPSSPDEAVTRDVVMGRQEGERVPQALLVVVDATNLDNHLRFVLQLKALGRPMVVALNMIDMAARDGLAIDEAALSRELGVAVVPTVAVRRRGLDTLLEAVDAAVRAPAAAPHDPGDIIAYQREARRIAKAASTEQHGQASRWSDRVDRVTLHPVFGPFLFVALMFVMFQAVFAWSEAPIGWIEGSFATVQEAATALLPDGFVRSFLVEGLIAGVGSVLVFLPQIVILFFFILLLESTGYMVRAAFMMDRVMAGVGLSGRAFIPLLSSFACAIPGIMATRTIDEPKERLTTILVAPLATCSARLPVYGVLIQAFIPPTDLGWGVGLQGLVFFGLYVVGIASALLVSLLFRRTVARGEGGGFMMELPRYQAPVLRDILIGLWQRAWIFLRRAGTLILTAAVLLWALLAFPQAPPGQSQVEYSAAGRIASGLEVVVKPIGFTHEMALAIIPALAAREVAVTALAQVYAIEADDETLAEQSLVERLRGRWSLPSALAFLMWFVFAPQCLSTIAVIRRETAGWKWPLFALGYLFVLAYLAAGLTFWAATAAGL